MSEVEEIIKSVSSRDLVKVIDERWESLLEKVAAKDREIAELRRQLGLATLMVELLERERQDILGES